MLTARLAGLCQAAKGLLLSFLLELSSVWSLSITPIWCFTYSLPFISWWQCGPGALDLFQAQQDSRERAADAGHPSHHSKGFLVSFGQLCSSLHPHRQTPPLPAKWLLSLEVLVFLHDRLYNMPFHIVLLPVTDAVVLSPQ